MSSLLLCKATLLRLLLAVLSLKSLSVETFPYSNSLALYLRRAMFGMIQILNGALASEKETFVVALLRARGTANIRS